MTEATERYCNIRRITAPSDDPNTSTHRTRPLFTCVDWAVAFLFFLFSCSWFLAIWQGETPSAHLDGDPANIITFALAKEHPELFINDALLNDQNNFSFYIAAQLEITRLFYRLIPDVDIGTAVQLLHIPYVTLQLLGFYLLGRYSFDSRIFSVLLSASTLSYQDTGLGTFWGMHHFPMPRSMFQSILPWVMIFALTAKQSNKNVLILMFISGIMMYVHGVAAPAWACAFWLGCFLLLPSKSSLKERGFWMLLAVGVFILAITPYAIGYLGGHAHGTSENAEKVYAISRIRFSPAFFDVQLAISEFYKRTSESLYLPIGFLSGAILLVFAKQDRRKIATVWLWLVGITTACFVIPYIEQSVARWMNSFPLEIDLVRNSRFIVPISQIFIFWLLAKTALYLKNRYHKLLYITPVILASFLLVSSWQSTKGNWISKSLPHWINGTLKVPSDHKKHKHRQDVLTKIINHTNPGDRILPGSNDKITRVSPLLIRYFSKRPVVYARKDGGAFAYANHNAFIQWYDTKKKFDKILSLPVSKQEERLLKAREWLRLSKELKADYFLVDFSVSDISEQLSLDGAELVFSVENNKPYKMKATLLRVKT